MNARVVLPAAPHTDPDLIELFAAEAFLDLTGTYPERMELVGVDEGRLPGLFVWTFEETG